MSGLQFSPLLITPDTNVLVSGGTISPGAPSQIIDVWREGRLDFALSPPILNEVGDVLSRPYFKNRVGWSDKTIAKYVNELKEGSYIFPGTTSISVTFDPDDNMLFSTAIEAGVIYIVSGDLKHVVPIREFEGIKVVSPSEFVSKVLRINKST